MSRPPQTTPKDDDDSWGKLASDLLGIDLNVDEDLEFPEPEPPAAVAPVVVPPPAPPAAAPRIEAAPLADAPAGFDDEPSEFDFDFEQADEPVATGEPAETDRSAEPVADTASEKADDPYWNALEDWDWGPDGNTSRPVAGRTPAAEESGGPRGGGRGQDRDRRAGRDRGGRGRDRDRGGDRERGGERDRVGNRERLPDRDRSSERRRDEPVSGGEAPRRSERERPARKPPAERPPTRRPPERKSAPTDDFGLGIEDELLPLEAAADDWVDEPLPPRAVAEFDDDFSDEFADENEGRPSPGGLKPGEDTTEDGERPRRRRRRRRRRSGSGEERTTAESTGEPLPVDEELDEDELPARASADEDDRPDEEGESREARPRRRRRRRRSSGEPSGATDERPRRPEPRPERTERIERTSEAHDDHDEFDDEEPEPAPPPRRTYMNIPTWEEAISYMLKSRPPESRGRSDGGDRRGSRPSRRPPRSDGA